MKTLNGYEERMLLVSSDSSHIAGNFFFQIISKLNAEKLMHVYNLFFEYKSCISQKSNIQFVKLGMPDSNLLKRIFKEQ